MSRSDQLLALLVLSLIELGWRYISEVIAQSKLGTQEQILAEIAEQRARAANLKTILEK